MPRIPNWILESTFYLYPTVEDANNGEAVGGSGFIVDVPSEVDNRILNLYGVTNSHVVRNGNSVLRINTQDGKFLAVPVLYSETQWKHHPDGDDVAAIAITLNEPTDMLRLNSIPIQSFINDDEIKEWEIGPGDDVFMVGRFINHEGKQKNVPSVRFGHISMMPDERVQHPSGLKVESFVVEMVSWSGYSGSPVFVYAINPSFLGNPPNKFREIIGNGKWWLLGVNWGLMRADKAYEIVRNRVGNPLTFREATGEHNDEAIGWKVQGNAGLINVTPAWKLLELLNDEEFVVQRKENDREFLKMLKGLSDG